MYVSLLSRAMLSDLISSVEVYVVALWICVAGDTVYSLSDMMRPLGPNQEMATFKDVFISTSLWVMLHRRERLSPSYNFLLTFEV